MIHKQSERLTQGPCEMLGVDSSDTLHREAIAETVRFNCSKLISHFNYKTRGANKKQIVCSSYSQLNVSINYQLTELWFHLGCSISMETD